MTAAQPVFVRLREVLEQLAFEHDPARLTAAILDRAIALVGAERGFAILVSDEDGGARFKIAAARNMGEEDVRKPEFEVSRSVVARVARTGVPELLDDAVEHPTTRHITSVQALQVHSILCVPLVTQGRTLGVVYLDHRLMRGEFTKEDLETLRTFAVPAALVLDAARRASELAQSRNELAQRVATIERLRAELAERYREKAREALRLADDEARRHPRSRDATCGLVARSRAMRRVVQEIEKLAPSNLPVLVTGESGTGKERVARALHALSPRAARPFHAESCAALEGPLAASELFGHEAGAFTGATARRAGAFELAHGSTLLLDEVGEMELSLQAKLLRVLQEGVVRRVGGDAPVAVDVRVIATTHRDLETMVAQGTFRADLYYRLAGARIELPPLRERVEDLPALVDELLAESPAVLDPTVREILLGYSWPGNVRELGNELRRLATLAAGKTVGPALLSRPIVATTKLVATGPEDPLLPETWELDLIEKEAIERALRHARGNKTVAARLLGIPKTTLYHRLEKHGRAT
jgi:transcriptional regulator with GAF, ATPase, and Fis domain